MKQFPISGHVPWAITTALIFAAGVMWIRDGRNFWSTPDRRAQLLLEDGDAKAAAESFADPSRRGVAEFRAGDFKASASTFSGLPGQDATFNQATARVMLGEYDKAIQLYDRVLKESPNRQDAIINREIATGRAKRTADEGGEMTGGMLGADEIVFGDTPADQGGEEVDVQEERLSDEEMQSMWLRQVQTTPGDFLRTKFAYQESQKTSATEDSSNE